MTPWIRETIQAIAKQVARSPQQEEMFEAGAEAVVQMIVQAGLEQTVLPEVKAQIEELQKHAIAVESHTAKLRQEFAAMTDPASLDQRARATVALTAALLAAYSEVLIQRRPQAGGSSYRLPQESEINTIARSVSYSVWAYLNPGVAMGPEAREGTE